MSDRLTIKTPDPKDYGQRLARLADRLGVSPMPPDDTAELIFAMPNGESYNVLAIVEALLDRLDAVDPS